MMILSIENAYNSLKSFLDPNKIIYNGNVIHIFLQKISCIYVISSKFVYEIKFEIFSLLYVLNHVSSVFIITNTNTFYIWTKAFSSFFPTMVKYVYLSSIFSLDFTVYLFHILHIF